MLKEFLLGNPVCYRLFSRMAGGHQRLVKQFLRPKPGEKVLDLGCGEGAILDSLPAGVDYQGFDVSQPYIDSARRRFPTRGRFACSDIGALAPGSLGRFDLVMANGVLHHLDNEQALHLLRLARSALQPGGRFVSVDGCCTRNQSWLTRRVMSMDRGGHIRRDEEYVALARTVFPSIKTHIYQLRVLPYTNLVMECGVTGSGAAKVA